MPDATITSTASTFGTISGTFAADQSTIVGTVTGIVAGTLDGSVGVPGPAGEQGPVGPEGPPGPPGVGGTWGSILGDIEDQGDLWTELGTKYLASNPAGYQTAGQVSTALAPYLLSSTASATYQTQAAMSAYLTTSAAAAGYYPLSGNPSGFLTAASLSGYATESWVTGQGYITSSALSPYLLSSTAAATYQTLAGMSDYAQLSGATFTGNVFAPTPSPGTDSTRIATTEWVKDFDYAPTNSPHFTGNPQSVTPNLSDNDTSIATTAFVKGQAYLTSSALVGYATESYVTSALTGYATESWVAGLGYITTLDANAAFYPLTGNPSGFVDSSFVYSQNYLQDAPSDGNQYARKDGAWDIVSGGYITSVTSPLAVTGSDLSINLSAYAPLASPALTGNVTITTNSTSPALFIQQAGTGNILTLHDQAGDTTFVAIDQNGKIATIPSATGGAGFNVPHGVAPTTPVNGDIWTTTTGLFMRQNGATQQYVSLGETQTISGNKTFSNANLTLGNNTGAGTINIGSGATVSGATKAVNIGTAGVAGSTTNIAIGSTTGTSTTTLQGITNGVTQSAGDSSLKLATTAFVTTADNLKANIASPSLTGTPLSTTAAADTNTTQIATTAFVVGQAGSATPLVNGTAAVGTSLRYARQDHIHPTDTTRAALDSPTFTGTPSLPTGTTGVTQTAGNNTTALATTAFVTAAVPAFATFTTPSPTSTTTAVSPKVVMDFMMHPGFRQWNVRGSSNTSGAGAAVQAYSTGCTELVGPNVSVAGFSMATWDTGVSSFGMLGMTRGANGLARAWNKPVWASGRGQHGYYADANYNGTVNSVVRVSVGGKSFAASGDISINDPGFGWYYIPGSAMVLQVSRGNGTSLTNVTTSFTPNAREIFDWKIYSDGAGNVTLYINDAQVATTTAGPTTATAESFNFYFESVEQTASAAARIVWESINPKIYWGV
jgi:hypothetical protein